MKQRLMASLLLLLLSMVVFASFQTRNGAPFLWDLGIKPENPVQAQIVRVVDGDTIQVLLEGNKESLRLIGVDTPETVHPSRPVEFFGMEASNFTKTMFSPGETVYLTFDWDPRDKYNRLLAYTWFVSDTGCWVLHNLALVVNGYGHAYTVFAFRDDYMALFSQAGREAREKQIGLWRVEPTITPEPPTSGKNGLSIGDIQYEGGNEWVEIRNEGTEGVNLSGWKIMDEAKNSYTFGETWLEPGETFKLYSGPDAGEPTWTRLYVWNNSGDTAQLFSPQGVLTDERTYP